jgi:hypothetical protein
VRLPAVRAPAFVVAVGLALSLQPATASATPLPEVCAAGRVPVATTFPLEACVEGDGVRVRNSSDVVVVVSGSGDLGAPALVGADDGPLATVTRLAVGGEGVLLPGDVVRWPLGQGPAGISVVEGAPATETIAAELAAVLPDQPEPDALRRHASLIGDLLAGIEARRSCLRGQNFLGRAACDVGTATVIGRAVTERLPDDVAPDVGMRLLDPDRWTRWSGLSSPQVRGSLQIPAVAPPVPAATIETPPEQGGGPAPPPPIAQAQPVPAPPAVPVPVPVPAPAQVPPRADGPSAGPAQAEDGRDKDRGNRNGNGKGNGKKK